MKNILIGLVMMILIGIPTKADIIWTQNTTIGEIINLSKRDEILQDKKLMKSFENFFELCLDSGLTETQIKKQTIQIGEKTGQQAMTILMKGEKYVNVTEIFIWNIEHANYLY